MSNETRGVLNVGIEFCDVCGQRHFINIVKMFAQPTETVTGPVTVENVDVYGQRMGRNLEVVRTVEKNVGPHVSMQRRPDNGEAVWTYEWPCGDHYATTRRTAEDRFKCGRCGGRQTHHISGPGVRTCECCGGSGVHFAARTTGPQCNPVAAAGKPV